ncbi:MAG: right-handed parallel beta-helix repeat-containing protein, partial [Clostridiales Family XIII bacterium]|nr:right-handed parallel beta-helix repeat-containing protein [Clostridiales Family XIII bacterium]
MKGTLRIIPAIAAAIFLTALFPIAASASSSGGALSGALSGGAYPSVTMGEAISAPAQAGGAAAISAGTAWTGTPATSATVAPGGTAAGIAGALPTASGAGIDAGGLATGEAGAGATDAPGAGTDEAGMPGAEGAAAGTEGAPAAAADGGTAAAPEADAATQAAQFSPLAAMEANTVDQLKGMMEAAAEGDVITLGAGFAADLAAKGPVSAAISHSNSFTIDGKAAGTLEAASGKRHFIIERAGGGKTVFSGLDIKGAASGAGGIEMTGGAYVFSSCAFVDISAMAALAVSGSAQVEIDSSSFSGNRTAVDMGADAAAGKSLAAKGSSFEDSAMSAIIAGSAALSLDGCVFARGGDTAVQGGISVEISQCSFVNNVGQAKAGALAASPAGSYRISRSSFVGNSNAGGPGGAVSLSQGTEFVIDRSSFAG